jgi:hypothetical protein
MKLKKKLRDIIFIEDAKQQKFGLMKCNICSEHITDEPYFVGKRYDRYDWLGYVTFHKECAINKTGDKRFENKYEQHKIEVKKKVKEDRKHLESQKKRISALLENAESMDIVDSSNGRYTVYTVEIIKGE